MGTSQIREAVTAGRAFIDKLSTLAQSAVQLGRQTNDLDSVFRQIDELRNQLRSPVVRLPSDLLSEIFLYFREFRTYTISPRDPEEQTAIYQTFKPFDPLILSWVCRRWRLVALDTPLLWTNVIFRPNQLIEDPFQAQAVARTSSCSNTQYADRYEAFVQRSQQACLSLDLWHSTYGEHWASVQEVERLVGCGRFISPLKLAAQKSEYDAARKVLHLIQDEVEVLDLSDRRGWSLEATKDLAPQTEGLQAEPSDVGVMEAIDPSYRGEHNPLPQDHGQLHPSMNSFPAEVPIEIFLYCLQAWPYEAPRYWEYVQRNPLHSDRVLRETK